MPSPIGQENHQLRRLMNRRSDEGRAKDWRMLLLLEQGAACHKVPRPRALRAASRPFRGKRREV